MRRSLIFLLLTLGLIGCNTNAQSQQTASRGGDSAVADASVANRGALAAALTHETGRPLTRTHLYIDMARDLFRQYAELARAFGGRVAPSKHSPS